MRAQLEASYALLDADESGYHIQRRYVEYDRETAIEQLRRVKHPTVDFLAKMLRGEILPPWAQRA